MNVLIETYRGFEIEFNTESERFSFVLDEGRWSEKQSYAACKLNIDKYLKENACFKPFKVRNKYNPERVIEITGIRKDGLFVSNRACVGKYDENLYIEYNPGQDAIVDDLRKINDKIHNLEVEASLIKQRLVGKTLSDLKSNYITPAK